MRTPRSTGAAEQVRHRTSSGVDGTCGARFTLPVVLEQFQAAENSPARRPPGYAPRMRPPLVCLLLASSLSCSSATIPPLIELQSLEPRAAETLDTLELSGEGFPERTAGHVTFTGTVHRVGEGPTSLRIATPAAAESQTTLRLQLTPELTRGFLGDRGAQHATFRGSLEVGFAPRIPGAPPITGTLKPVVLDVFAASGAAPQEASDASPSAVMERFGWVLARQPGSAVCVTQVRDDALPSPVLAGDCLESFAGVNVFDTDDLVPYPSLRSAEVVVRRDGLAETLALEVDVSGLRPQSPGTWRWALVFGAVIAAMLLVYRSPLAMGWALIESKLSSSARREPHASTAASAGSSGHERASWWSLLPFLTVSALFAASGLGLVRPLADFDLLLVFGSAATLFGVAQFLGGGYRRTRWSLWRALLALVRGSAVHLTVIAALATAVLQHASLSLVETASHQGASPWGFSAFRSLGSYLAGLTLLCCIVLLGLCRFDGRSRSSGIRLTQVLLDAYTWTLSGLFVAVYLGGWEAPRALSSWLSPEAASLVTFQLKLTSIFAAVSWLRGILPKVNDRTLIPVFWRWLLPLAASAGLLDLVWVSGEWPIWLESASRWALLCGSGLALTLLAARLVHWRRSPPATFSVNPWL